MEKCLAARARMSMLAFLAAAGATLLSAMAAHAQNAFIDTFDTAGVDPSFTNVAGTWTASGGTYSVSSNVQGTNFSLLTKAGDTNFSNFSFSYDIPACYDGGLVFHMDSTVSNGLALIVRPDFSDAYFIVRSGGNWNDIYTHTSMAAAVGSSLHVVVTDQNNNYTATISKGATPTVPIATLSLNGNATAAGYASGYVGFYSYGDGAGLDHYDNLVFAVPEPSTWVAALTGGALLGAVWWRQRRRATA